MLIFLYIGQHSIQDKPPTLGPGGGKKRKQRFAIIYYNISVVAHDRIDQQLCEHITGLTHSFMHAQSAHLGPVNLKGLDIM